MDFAFSPEADDAAALAADIVAKEVTPDRQKQVEADGSRFDAELWSSLSEAGLLSLHLPEASGGAGLGLLESLRVLVELGRAVAPVPAADHVAATALLAESGSDADGLTAPLTVAVTEALDHQPATPLVSAAAEGDGWTLSGTKVLVRAARRASSALVTASTPDGPRVFRVDLGTDGVEIADQHTSDGDIAGMVTFSGAAASPVGESDAVRRLHDLSAVCSAAELLGITEGALSLTAAYATSREQFGRPIGVFQGVRHRLADGHIDLLGQRLTLWQAAWRISEGLPAETEVATAALWAADAAHRIAHTTVHVHGGVGIDLDGEAHRYFTAAKRWEFATGGATRQALALGRALADA